MIGDILKSVFSNFQVFLVTWIIVILVNQIFIFGACFAPYCLIAALPHTGVIAALITYFSQKNEASSAATNQNNSATYERPSNKEMDFEIEKDDFEDTKTPFCPECGAPMVLRTAKKGQYAGKTFWGCSKYPNCKGILKHT